MTKIILAIVFTLLAATTSFGATATIGDNTGNTFSGTVDVTLKSNVPTTNLDLGALEVHKYGVGDHGNSLIKFTGLSNITGPVTVTSATLYVYPVAAASGGIDLAAHRLLRNWVEGEATWNVYSTGNNWGTPGGISAGIDIVGTASATASFDSTTLAYRSWSSAGLIADVEAWINGTASNYGWLIQRVGAGDDGSYHIFTDSEGADATRPYLDITYTSAGSSSAVRHRVINQ